MRAPRIDLVVWIVPLGRGPTGLDNELTVLPGSVDSSAGRHAAASVHEFGFSHRGAPKPATTSAGIPRRHAHTRANLYPSAVIPADQSTRNLTPVRRATDPLSPRSGPRWAIAKVVGKTLNSLL